MANTQAICNSFKTELMTATHDMDGTDSLKAALFLASATVDKTTTAYSTTGEVTGTGYTAGGVAVTSGTPTLDGDIAHWTPGANFAWTGATLATAFDAVEIYNSSKANAAIAVFTFGSQTVTAGNFTLTMPTDDGINGLIRLN